MQFLYYKSKRISSTFKELLTKIKKNKQINFVLIIINIDNNFQIIWPFWLLAADEQFGLEKILPWRQLIIKESVQIYSNFINKKPKKFSFFISNKKQFVINVLNNYFCLKIKFFNLWSSFSKNTSFQIVRLRPDHAFC